MANRGRRRWAQGHATAGLRLGLHLARRRAHPQRRAPAHMGYRQAEQDALRTQLAMLDYLRMRDSDRAGVSAR